jgi:hypothetical protein
MIRACLSRNIVAFLFCFFIFIFIFILILILIFIFHPFTVSGIRDRLKVHIFPFIPDAAVAKYLTSSVNPPFSANDASLVARIVGGHMGNVLEVITDYQSHGLKTVLSTIVGRAADQFRDVLLTPPCSHGEILCDPTHWVCVYVNCSMH